nr:hypothetical protein [Tanacetum cinerariifolium]
MSVLLAKERIIKLIQDWDEKQIKSWSLPKFLLQLSNESRTIDEMLKQRKEKRIEREQAVNLAVQEKQEEHAAQSFTPYWNSHMIYDVEVLQARENLMKAIHTFLNNFNRYPFGVKLKVLSIAWERFFEIKHAFTNKQYQREEIQGLMRKLLEDVRNINEELFDYTNSSSWNHPMFSDDEEHSIQYRLYLENSSKAITPVLPTKEHEYSLSMRDEHLSTILETESEELIKSGVENLIPIPSEYKVTFDNKSECDVPVNDESSLILTTFSNPLFDCNNDFTSSDDESLSNEDVLMENFKIYSNPLFDDEEIISIKIDPHYFNVESNIIESLLNRDALIDSSPKFDYLLELAHINQIPPGIEEADFDLEEEICLSLSPSPIPVEDGDSHMEEIDLFLATDELMPPGIENDDYDSKGDVYFLEEMFSNDPIPFPKINVEVFFDSEPDSGELILAVMNNIDELNEDDCFDPGG